jgi:hypothetical protein
MALNLQVDQDLTAGAQSIKDENGNTSPLVVSTDRVGIGNPSPRGTLDVFGLGDHLVRITDTNTGNRLLIGTDDTTPNFMRIRPLGGDGLAITNNGDELGVFVRASDGHVGIGTRSPTEKLDVNGNITATGDVILTGADCAEDFDVEEGQPLDPGLVMVIADGDTLRQCTEPYDKRVAGVLSGAGDFRPGIVLGRQQAQENRMPLALSGKAFCKVDAQYSAIGVGDLLTTSPTPGHAMKAGDPLKAFGAVIGKALRPLTEGQGLIPILIALQ